MSAKLWRAYLRANSVRPRGFHISNYWYAHTGLERAGALLPFPSYGFVAPYHGLEEEAEALIRSTMASAPLLPAAAYAANTRAFVNAVGSAGDPDSVKALLNRSRLTPAAGLAYLGNGFDFADAGWGGEPVPKGHAAAAAALRNVSLAPFLARRWRPLNLSTQALVFAKGGAGWDAYTYSYTTSAGKAPPRPAGDLGCFSDPVCPSDWSPSVSQATRKMFLLGWDGSGMTRAKCRASAVAEGLRYYALQNGAQCW